MNEEPVPASLFVTIPRAAKIIGVEMRTIKNAIVLGQLPSIELGRRRLIPRKAILELAEKSAA